MANLVITIGRENGSGGRQLGSELAAALGVKCYDSELINETAKASGFATSFVETHEEQRPGSFLYSLVTGGGVIADDQPFPVQIFQAPVGGHPYHRGARVVCHRRPLRGLCPA